MLRDERCEMVSAQPRQVQKGVVIREGVVPIRNGTTQNLEGKRKSVIAFVDLTSVDEDSDWSPFELGRGEGFVQTVNNEGG